MKIRAFVVLVGFLLTGIGLAEAQAAPVKTAESRLTIIPTGIEQPEMIKVNTGRKAQMKDGQVNTVYETWKPKEGNVYLEIKADLSVDPGPLFLETPMIRLEGPSHDTAAAIVPVYWYLDTGLEPARADSVTIRAQAGLDLTFEVPVAMVDGLTLWIGGLRVASVPEIRDRMRRQLQGK
jgi:hypothetical protein